MNKITVTPQQRANALEALNIMWPSVPKRNVAVHLGTWRNDESDREPTCGTVACFGGWCAWWPSFRAQGVSASSYGAPTGENMYWSSQVARKLFGVAEIFDEREGDECGSDHAVVAKRLRNLIKNSVVEA